MEQINLSLAAVGIVVLVLGFFSRSINCSYFSIPLLAFVSGVVLGPLGFGVLNPESWGNAHKLLEEAARLTLGISLMAIALRIPKNYLFQNWRSFIVLLGLGMPLMLLVGGLLAYAALDVSVVIALLIGAAICPTDPVVASAIVTGGLAKKDLPQRFRYGISTESAANDGLAYPLVFLPLLLLISNDNGPWLTWFIDILLRGVGGALIFGSLLGWCVGQALLWAERKKTLDHSAFLVTTLALTISAMGLGKILGVNSILTVFVAGIVFSHWVGGEDRAIEANVQEAVNLFFTLPVFILFGLMLPVDKWLALGWGGAVFIVGVFLLRRIPIILILSPLLPIWRDWKMALLSGHFGPIGISAIFYAMVILEKSGNDFIWGVVSLVAATSLVVHGVTAAPLARLWAKNTGETRG